MSARDLPVPFNDMSRIHSPLVTQFTDALVQIVDNSTFVLGHEVQEFENELAILEGCRYAIGLNSGTSAIELALRAFDIGPGDEVITTSLTFVATCFAILQTGATPVLIDIDPTTGLLQSSQIEKVITKKTKAVVFVTLHGRVGDIDRVRDICTANNLRFIIDGAQSHLGRMNNTNQSNFADATTLSFYPGKNLGALGEAGAVLTNKIEIRDKIRMMRDWGASSKYIHETWGGNYRIEALQAAFLRIKLKKLIDWTNDRIRISTIYRENIEQELLLNEHSENFSHVYHIFSIQTNRRSEFCKSLDRSGVSYGFHYPFPIHRQKAYLEFVRTPLTLSGAELFASNNLSIPLFPGQTESEIARVIGAVNKANQN